MARTDIRSSNEQRRNSVAHAFEISPDGIESKSKVPCDVLQKDDGRTNLLHHSENMGPQVARIVCSTTAAGGAERLARVARSDDVHEAKPWAAIEGADI